MDEYQALFARSARKELEAFHRRSPSDSWRASSFSMQTPDLQGVRSWRDRKISGGSARVITGSCIPSMMSEESWTSSRSDTEVMPTGNRDWFSLPSRPGFSARPTAVREMHLMSDEASWCGSRTLGLEVIPRTSRGTDRGSHGGPGGRYCRRGRRDGRRWEGIPRGRRRS